MKRNLAELATEAALIAAVPDWAIIRESELKDERNPMEVMLPALEILRDATDSNPSFSYTQRRATKDFNAYDYSFKLPEGRFVLLSSESVKPGKEGHLVPTGKWAVEVQYQNKRLKKNTRYSSLKRDISDITRKVLK